MRMLSGLLVLLMTALFAWLPFLGPERMFSISVPAAWRAGAEARRVRRVYWGLVGGIGLAGIAAAGSRPWVAAWAPVGAVLVLLGAWSWGWRRTLPHRAPHAVVREASLGAAAGGASLVCLAALAPLAAAAAVLAARYRTLPARFAIHYGANGQPNHIVGRSRLSVFGVLLLGGVLVLLLAGILRLVDRRGAGVADGGRYRALTGEVVAGAAWLLALTLAWVSLLPLSRDPGRQALLLSVFAGAAVSLLLTVSGAALLRRDRMLAAGQQATDEGYWKAGLVYFNREDGALFVPKRMGFGWTLNMARPAAWVLVLGVVGVGVGVLAWVVR